MRGVICYFSATGNTKLAVDYLLRRLGGRFDLCDIARQPAPDLSGHDIVGLASPVERMAEPRIVRDFMQSLPPVQGKPAFPLATYGAIAGRTLENLTEAAHAVIEHAFTKLGASALFAGHNPANRPSRHLLLRLGFRHIGGEL